MKPQKAGWVGGAVGLLAAGAAVGLAAQRYAIGRLRSGDDPAADEPYGRLPADRTRVVVAGDGVPLYVEEVGPLDAPLTVVFVHGYTLEMGAWHYQRRDLADLTDPAVRMVFYDQRSHGRSGRGPAAASTIDQLGRDLARILDAVDDGSPIVLVGHSMGGMAIMALADQKPDRFGTSVAGVALLSTSSGGLRELRLGLPAALASLQGPIVPVLALGMRARPSMVERGRRAARDLAWLLTRHYSFGTADVSPALVSYVEQMISATPVDVIGEFLVEFMSHDKLSAVSQLAEVETLVVVGEKDMLTPAEHSRAIAEAVPRAELLVVTGAGHLAPLERPEVVNDALRDLIRRSADAAGRPRRRRTERRRREA
jgi:pimeloyl-ACP methyl ester carboxylesterase